MLRGAYERSWNQRDKIAELTDREQQIAALVISGLTNQQIAEKLGVRVQTLKNQLASIYEKVGVKGLGGRRNEVVGRALAVYLKQGVLNTASAFTESRSAALAASGGHLSRAGEQAHGGIT